MHDAITIRRAESTADYHACRDAQRRAWGISDESYVVPIATMVGAQLHGGLVLGAFLPSGEAVGVSFAFLGRIEGRLCLYSQLTGIVPGQQSRGLGLRLKQAQREQALADGIDLIAWAFDPLQAGNAHFNLTKLGATAGRYIDNMYGLRTDALNAGVPTDRLIAEWELAAPSPAPLALGEVLRLPKLVETAARSDGHRTVMTVHAPEAPRVLLEIPDHIADLRTRDASAAERWRQAVRDGLTSAFSRGYRAVAFVRDQSDGERRGYYLLESHQ
jgi:predicted GNAT superfamily acetyltransferase